MTSSIIKRLAQSTPPADIDRSAMIRELTRYSSGDDAAVAATLGTILDTPHLATARGLSEALAHLLTLERQPLSDAAAEALTRLWTDALDPLPDHERRRAARLASSLDPAPPAHRVAWALRSRDPGACADVASHFTQEHWDALRPILTGSLEPNAQPALLRAIFERSDEGVRAGALELLDDASDPTLLESLAGSLRGSSSSYLTALAHALDRMGRVEAEPILLAILTSHSREVAEDLAALQALSTLGTATSVAPLHRLEDLSDRSSPFHDAITQTLEHLTQRLSASGPAGALSLTSSTSREGALSLHDSPGEGALALYASVTRHTSGVDAARPAHEPGDLVMVEPRPPLSFWLTWPLFNHHGVVINFLVYFMFLPFGIFMLTIGLDSIGLSKTPDVSGQRARPGAYALALCFVAGSSYLVWNTTLKLEEWRAKGWFALLSGGWLTHVELSRASPPRLERNGDIKHYRLRWTDEHGVLQLSSRPPMSASHSMGTEGEHQHARHEALVRGSHAFVPKLDTPFHLDTNGDLRLDASHVMGAMFLSSIYAFDAFLVLFLLNRHVLS